MLVSAFDPERSPSSCSWEGSVRFNLWLLRVLLKVGMPVVLLMVPLLAVFGWISPWPPAATSLARYADQTPVLVGFSYRSRHSMQSHEVRSSRSYILLPGLLSEPKIVTVVQENGEIMAPHESRLGFWLYLAGLIAYGVGTWWFWSRRVRHDHASENV
jgi:hypothetical protein